MKLFSAEKGRLDFFDLIGGAPDPALKRVGLTKAIFNFLKNTNRIFLIANAGPRLQPIRYDKSLDTNMVGG